MAAQALLISSTLAMLGVTIFVLLRQPVGSLRYQFLLRVATPCNYGQQAYQFRGPLPRTDGSSSQPQQWTFQARSERCRLRPFVGALLAGRTEDGWPGRQLRILFNGDRCGSALQAESAPRAARLPMLGCAGQMSPMRTLVL